MNKERVQIKSMRHFSVLLMLSLFTILFSSALYSNSQVLVSVPDTNLNSAKKIKYCIKDKADLCINNLCRYAVDPACHAKCEKHAAAKCNPSPYDHKAETKSKTYDKVMNIADTLNDCISLCSKSTDRNCAHQCKKDAKKNINN